MQYASWLFLLPDICIVFPHPCSDIKLLYLTEAWWCVQMLQIFHIWSCYLFGKGSFFSQEPNQLEVTSWSPKTDWQLKSNKSARSEWQTSDRSMNKTMNLLLSLCKNREILNGITIFKNWSRLYLENYRPVNPMALLGELVKSVTSGTLEINSRRGGREQESQKG